MIDTAAPAGTPGSALQIFTGFDAVRAKLLPEFRSGSNAMQRWQVIAPLDVLGEQVIELRSWGVQVVKR